MSQFIRPVDKHVENLLVPDIEALRHLSDELNHHIPDFLCDGKLDAVRHHVLEETADGLIVGKSPCRGSRLYCMAVIAVMVICEENLRIW